MSKQSGRGMGPKAKELRNSILYRDGLVASKDRTHGLGFFSSKALRASEVSSQRFRLRFSPGRASVADLHAFFQALSDLNEANGGDALTFRIDPVDPLTVWATPTPLHAGR